MRRPNKQHASFRLDPEARRRLAELAAKRSQTQTAVLEGLINDAANGADAHFDYFAAYYARMTYTLVSAMASNALGGAFQQRLNGGRIVAEDLFGPAPVPPQDICDRARARFEAGQLSPERISILRSFGLLEHERSWR